MSCPPSDDLVSYIDGELPLNQHRQLEQHAETCARCRAELDELRRIVARVAPRAGEWDDIDLLADVERTIAADDGFVAVPSAPAAVELDDVARARRRRWLRYAFIAAPTLAAAAVLLLVALPIARMGNKALPGSGAAGFQARGGSDGGLHKWVRLWIYRRTKAGYAQVAAGVPRDARLVFGYRNASPKLRYIMIVGVGADGRLHWYYPADGNKAATTSVAIKQGKHELPDEVVHPLGAGPLTIHALFSGEPLQSAKVAHALAQRDAKLRSTPLSLQGVAEIVRQLRVTSTR